MHNERVLREITPLKENDFMYVVDRHKMEFTYPIHAHDAFELNFVINGRGVHRIVGDSMEIIGDYDLVLITGADLEHVWSQGDCRSKDIREITIQFRMPYKGQDNFFGMNPLKSIGHMLTRAQRGLAFPLEAIMLIYPRLVRLPQLHEQFYAWSELLTILYELSKCETAYELATDSFAKVDIESENRRILKIESYVSNHFMDEIRLSELADMVHMSPCAFSRFFRLSTGKTVSGYITDIRLGAAARRLIDTDDGISEICYDCGFNTLSNFNRLFRKHKGCSPTEFREKYFKTKVVI